MPTVLTLLFCLPLTLASRTSQDNCWVQYPTEIGTLCISKQIWVDSILKNQYACGRWLIQKKYYSPPLNPPDSDSNIKTFQITQKIITFTPDPYSKNNQWKATLQKCILKFENFREDISNIIRPNDSVGILKKLLLNESPSKNASSDLRIHGYVHILTATGIHLYALASHVEALSKHFCLWLKVPIRAGFFIQRFITWTLWFLAWLLSGAREGMLRPILVIFLRTQATQLGFKWKKWSPLLTALGIDICIAIIKAMQGHSNSYTHSGRWVYALAVGGGLMTLESHSKRTGKQNHLFENIKQHFRLAIGSWIGVALYEITQNEPIAIFTPLLSLATLPFFTIILFPSVLCISCLVLCQCHNTAENLAQLLATMSNSFLKYCDLIISALGFNLWHLSMGALLTGAIFGFFVLWIFQKRIKLQYTFIAGVLCILLLLKNLVPLDSLNRPNYFIRMLDVGQGDSILVNYTAGEKPSRGLIDTGATHTLKNAQWIRLFFTQGIEKLDWILLSHLDQDHSGALAQLLNIIQVRCVVAPRSLANEKRWLRIYESLKSLKFRKSMPRTSLTDRAEDCIPFPVKQFTLNSKSDNSTQFAIWIPFQQGGGFLSLGDSEIKHEQFIIPWLKTVAKSDIGIGERILKVSHHGSSHSTSQELLNLFQPTQAWISVGLNNRYGHPSTEVIKRLSHIKIRRTDLEGSLSIKTQIPRPAMN